MDYEFLSGIFITDSFNPNNKCKVCNTPLLYSRYKNRNIVIYYKSSNNYTRFKLPRACLCVRCMLKKKSMFNESYLDNFLDLSQKTVIEVSNHV